MGMRDDLVEQLRNHAKVADAVGGLRLANKAADELERLLKLCAGKRRVVELGGEPLDFDELCNRVLTREWQALDPEYLVGIAQGSFDLAEKAEATNHALRKNYDRALDKIGELEVTNRALREELEGVVGALHNISQRPWCQAACPAVAREALRSIEEAGAGK
jgi:hypothetical protein